MNLTSDAILYYADNPVDFVEDIIRAKPDSNQKAILNSVAKYPMTSVPGHSPRYPAPPPPSTSYGTSCGPKLRSGYAVTRPCLKS